MHNNLKTVEITSSALLYSFISLSKMKTTVSHLVCCIRIVCTLHLYNWLVVNGYYLIRFFTVKESVVNGA